MAVPKGMSESSFAQEGGGREVERKRDLRAEHRGKLVLFAGMWVFWAATLWKLYQHAHPEAEIVWGWLSGIWLVLAGLYALWVLWRLQLGRVPEARLKGSILTLSASEIMTLLSIVIMVAKYGLAH